MTVLVTYLKMFVDKAAFSTNWNIEVLDHKLVHYDSDTVKFRYYDHLKLRHFIH